MLAHLKDIFSVINQEKYRKGNYNYLVEDAVAQVGAGAGNPEIDGGVTNEMPHKAKISLTLYFHYWQHR